MNLGVTFQDITSIRFGDSPCVADEEHYIPGEHISLSKKWPDGGFVHVP